MKNSKVLKCILFFSGLVASAIGAAILFAPLDFYASYGTALEDDFSLLNELRATGGALMASGLLIMSGAFVGRLAFTATLVSVLLYLPYGLSRIMSMMVDGMPAEGFIQATILELATGLVCVFAFIKYKDRKTVVER